MDACLVLPVHPVALDLAGSALIRMGAYGRESTDLQASQAVFCLRGGGRVLASS